MLALSILPSPKGVAGIELVSLNPETVDRTDNLALLFEWRTMKRKGKKDIKVQISVVNK